MILHLFHMHANAFLVYLSITFLYKIRGVPELLHNLSSHFFAVVKPLCAFMRWVAVQSEAAKFVWRNELLYKIVKELTYTLEETISVAFPSLHDLRIILRKPIFIHDSLKCFLVSYLFRLEQPRLIPHQFFPAIMKNCDERCLIVGTATSFVIFLLHLVPLCAIDLPWCVSFELTILIFVRAQCTW